MWLGLLHGVLDVVTGPLDVASHALDGAAAAGDPPEQQSCTKDANYDSVR